MVDQILEELDLSHKPRILVLNKIDLLETSDGTPADANIQDGIEGRGRAVFVSGLNKIGMDRLKAEIDSQLLEIEAPALAVSN